MTLTERIDRLSPFVRYTTAMVFPLLATLLTAALFVYIRGTPSVLFFGGIAMAAWIGGFLPGLIATTISLILLDYFFVSPDKTVLTQTSDVATLIIFALVATLISFIENQRRTAQQSLQQSRDEIETILNNLADAVTVQDDTGKVVFANRSASTVTGYSSPDVIKSTSVQSMHQRFEMYDAEDKPITAADLPRVRVFQEKSNHSLAFRRYDKEIKSNSWIEVKSAPIFDNAGNVRLVANIMRDFTLQHDIETTLKAERTRLRHVLDELLPSVGLMTPDGIMLEVNRSALATIGATSNDVIGKPIVESPWLVKLPEIQKQIVNAIESARNGTPMRFDIDLPINDTDRMTLDFSISAVHDDTGKIEYLVSSALDITERKRAEVAIAQANDIILQERQRLTRLLNTLPGMVYEGYGNPVNYGQRLTFISDYAETLFGYNAQALMADATLWAKIIHAEDQPALSTKMERIYESGNSGTVEFRVSHADGRALDIEARSTPFADENGQIVGSVGFMVDISRRKATEQSLKTYATELYHTNAELEQFAYVASHDLQEPLRMVASYLQLLEQRYGDQLEGEAHEFIAFAVDGANRMKKLIQDLLAYARLQRNSGDLKSISMEDALGTALRNLHLTIEETGAIITHDPLPPLPANQMQVAQLLQNLIGNALKFRRATPPEIYIGAAQHDKEWHFSVKDNGIGIETQYLERIFVIFQRLHSRDEYPGTGIGLAICRKIVEYHGGRIWVDSIPDVGTTFHFTLPNSFHQTKEALTDGLN